MSYVDQITAVEMVLSILCRDRHQDSIAVQTLVQHGTVLSETIASSEQLSHYSQAGTTMQHCGSRDSRQPSV